MSTYLTAANIPESKQSEERLRLVARAFDQCPLSILIADFQGRIVYVNPFFERITGYSAAESIGQNPGFIKSGEHSTEFYQNLWSTITSGGEWSGNLHNRRKNGELFWERASISPLRHRHEQITHYLSIKRDITESKQGEDERREMESSLLLAHKLESGGRLAAGIAHEINTPAQYISDNTGFLSESFREFARFFAAARELRARATTVPELAANATALAAFEESIGLDYLISEIPGAIDQIHYGLEQIGRIVGSLKEFSKSDRSKMRRADLNRALETAITVSRHEWTAVAEVVTEFDPNLPGVTCVLEEVNQALISLIFNATHAIADANARLGRPFGRITIRTRARADCVVAEVEDTGTGIPSEFHKYIFEPFFTTKEIGKGSGLGLSVVRHIVVKRHGGRVDFSSEADKGSTFRITLPLDPGPRPDSISFVSPNNNTVKTIK